METLTNSKCDGFVHIENGIKIFKPKKKFTTDNDAIEAARIKNADPFTIHKLVAYKCKSCNFWHIGRTNKVITDKEREKYQRLLKNNQPIKHTSDEPNFKQVFLSEEQMIILRRNLALQ